MTLPLCDKSAAMLKSPSNTIVGKSHDLKNVQIFWSIPNYRTSIVDFRHIVMELTGSGRTWPRTIGQSKDRYSITMNMGLQGGMGCKQFSHEGALR